MATRVEVEVESPDTRSWQARLLEGILSSPAAASRSRRTWAVKVRADGVIVAKLPVASEARARWLADRLLPLAKEQQFDSIRAAKGFDWAAAAEDL